MTRTHAIRLVIAGSLILLAAAAVSAYAEAATPVEMTLPARVAMLGVDVQAAEDLRAIKRLRRSCGYYLDKGMWTDLAEYFTQDAVANCPAGVFIGKESIREHLYRNVGNVPMGQVGFGDGRLYNHLSIQPVVHLDADGQGASGRWRILATWNTLSAGYDGGWVRNAGRGMPGPSADYPPDAPPTREVAMFPVVFNIPYHYANPVSGRTELPALPSIAEQMQRFPVPRPAAPPPRTAPPGNGE